MNDASIYCRGLILAQTAVAALVSSRCYEGALVNDPTLPAIAFEPRSGDFIGPVQQWAFDVTCWATTRDGAVALHSALVTALSPLSTETQTISGKILSGIVVEGSGGAEPDPDTENYSMTTTISFWMAI